MRQFFPLLIAIMVTFLSPSNPVFANTETPAFELSAVKLELPLSAFVHPIEPERQNAGFVVIETNAQLFTDAGSGLVPLVANPSDSAGTTPYQTLQSLFSQYRFGDPLKLLSLYTTESQEFLRDLLSDSSILTSKREQMAQFVSAEILLSIKDGESVVTFVNVTRQQGSSSVVPFVFSGRTEGGTLRYGLVAGKPILTSQQHRRRF